MTIKDISYELYERLKDKRYMDQFNASDIERALCYYNKMIKKILLMGGFLTLSVYRNHKFERCIRIIPREKIIVHKRIRKMINTRTIMIRKQKAKLVE